MITKNVRLGDNGPNLLERGPYQTIIYLDD